MIALVLVVVAQAPFAFDVPGALEEVMVSGPVTTLGTPVELRAVRSSRPAVELLEHFAAAMVRAGLYVGPPARQPRLAREVHLAGLDTARLVSFTVVLQPRRDRTTTVILLRATLQPDARRPEPEGAPAFPGAERPLVSTAEGGTATAYTVRGATSEEIAGWYRAGHQGEGWREVAPLTFKKGELERVVAIGASRAGALPVVVVDRLVRGE